MMRKQKKNSFFRITGILVLVLVLALSLIACAEPEAPSPEDGDSTVTEVTLPVKNGNFEYVTGTSYPKTPKNWAFETGYTLSSSDSVHAYNGVIAVTDEAYALYADSYHLSANPGQKGTDNHVLMLNNVLSYSTSYRSETVSIAKGKYYELVVYAKTALASNETSGAYITLKSDAGTRTFSSFDKVQSNDWTAYSFWIEGSKSANMSVTLSLALGQGSDKLSADLAQGAAFFDSVTLTEKTKNDYDSVNGATAKKYSFALRNADFTETSGTISATNTVVTPYDWTTYPGRDDNGSSIAPTNGLSKGVIDTSIYTPTTGILKDDTSIGINTREGAPDNNVLMIYLSNADSPSAYSYYSNAITVEFDKIYKLSFWVRTAGLKDNSKASVDGATDKGVTVKLGDDITLFENVNTNKAWVQYTAYIKGSPTQSKNQSIYFWLGQGHSNDRDGFLSGAAFFDSITLEEITEDAYNGATESATVSKYEPIVTNILSINAYEAGANGDPKYWTGITDGWAENHGDETTRTAILKAIDLNSYASEATTYGLTAANPDTAVKTRANYNSAVVLFNKTANAFSTTFTQELTIKSNLSYRLSFWVKTEGIKSGKGASFAILNAEDDTALSTLSAINTEKFDEDGAVTSNEWTEIVFMIQGNQLEDNKVKIKLSLGSGDMYNPDYLSGTVFMSNMFLESATYKEYSNASSSTYIAKHSFRTTSSTQITNGSFNNIDVDKSEIDDNGKLIDKPGAVLSWTSAFATDAASKESNKVISGIINKELYESHIQGNAPTVSSPFFDESSDSSIYNGAPNLLMIQNTDATEYGYTSPSVSLTAYSYYKVTVNVKTSEMAEGYGAKIIVTNDGKVTTFENINTTSGCKACANCTDTDGSTLCTVSEEGWVTYTIYIKVGLNSSNLKLYLGLKTNGEGGIAFFDNATYTSVSKDDYKEATTNANTLKADLNFDSFTTNSDSATPTNYTGAVVGSAPSIMDTDFASGVLSLDHFDLDTASNFDLEESDVAPYDGGELLAIYNKKDTAYAYTSKSYTFNADTFYKISVMVKTKALAEGDKAKITLTLSQTETAVFYASDTEWKEYTFFVKMDDSALSGVTLALGLGEYNVDSNNNAITADYAKGYAFFDYVAIEEIDEASYNTGIAGITEATTDVKKIDVVAVNEDADNDTEEDAGDGSLTEGASLSAWEIIAIVSASLLSVALVAVLIVVYVKKLVPKMKEKKNKKYKKPVYDKRASKVATKDDLDKFKD